MHRKGKARTRYEFGVKVSIAVTNARANGGQFVVGIRAVPGLPYDGHTLKDQIAQVERLTGVAVTRAYVDKGYRGHGLETPDVHVSQSPVKRAQPSSASCEGAAPSNRSSVTPRATAFSSEIA